LHFAVIEFGKLLEVMWVSLVAGVGVTAVFSLVIFGSAQAGEARRDGRSGAAAYGALAAISLLVVAAGVVFALRTILNKG
jgi:hypothetical protein